MPCAFGTAGEDRARCGRPGRTQHRRARPGQPSDDKPTLCARSRAVVGGGLRLRGQRNHAGPPGRAGEGHRGAGIDAGERGARARTRRRLLVEWTGRSRGARLPVRHGGRLVGHVPVFGICLGHQLLATAARWEHLQTGLRPPRFQPSGQAPVYRPGGSHQPRTTTTAVRDRARDRGDPCQLE